MDVLFDFTATSFGAQGYTLTDNKGVQQNLSQLILKANEMDDYFVQEFGCEKSNYAKVE